MEFHSSRLKQSKLMSKKTRTTHNNGGQVLVLLVSWFPKSSSVLSHFPVSRRGHLESVAVLRHHWCRVYATIRGSCQHGCTEVSEWRRGFLVIPNFIWCWLTDITWTLSTLGKYDLQIGMFHWKPSCKFTEKARSLTKNQFKVKNSETWRDEFANLFLRLADR